MAKHPSAFINSIYEGRNFDEAINALQETWDDLQDLRAPFRKRIREGDWALLYAMMPDNEIGNIWKETIIEFHRAMLEQDGRGKKLIEEINAMPRRPLDDEE